MQLCIYASMHLCIYASMHLCIYASMYLCTSSSKERQERHDQQSREANTKICLKNHSKMLQKSLENRPTFFQKSTKIVPKIDPNQSQGPLGELWRPSWPQDGSKSQHRLQNLVRWTPLDVEVGGQNPPKIGPKLIQNVIIFCTYFLDRFLERFSANLVPTWLQNPPKMEPSWLQKPSKRQSSKIIQIFKNHCFLDVI